MKHFTFNFKWLVLSLLLCIGSSALAGTVTRIENFAASSASNDQYNCSSQATTSGMQNDWNYAWTPSTVYVFKSGIRLGTSSAIGSVTNTTMLSGISTGTSVTIKVYAARWNNDTGNLTVTYNGNSESKAPANSAITNTSNTYSSSNFSSSTNFTITKVADVTSFSIASSSKRIIIDKVEVIYDDGPAKSANELAWSAASKDVTYSETPYNLPTLTNPHSLAIEYESTDETVASIDSEGNVTIKNKTGNTTISAHTDGDATYAAGTVSYTLNVTRKFVLEDGIFDFAFTTAEGGGYGSGVTQNGALVEGSTSTWTSGNIVLAFANRYAWYADGTLRAYKSTGSYDASEITISCPSGKAITRIDFMGPYTGTGKLSNIDSNIGTYTVTSSSAIWTGAAQSVTFTASNSTYINTIIVTYGATVPATLSSNGYTTFAASCALDLTTAKLPSGVSAYKAAVDGTTVTFTELNQTIPANTGVLLKGTADATVNIPVAASGTAVEGNAFLVNEGGSTFAAESGYNYFGLKKGTLTFALFDPSAVAIPANKAYLKVAESAGVKSLNVVFDEATGISTLERIVLDYEAWYDLQGRRVAQPTKGIYIHNGKKIFVK